MSKIVSSVCMMDVSKHLRLQFRSNLSIYFYENWNFFMIEGLLGLSQPAKGTQVNSDILVMTPLPCHTLS